MNTQGNIIYKCLPGLVQLGLLYKKSFPPQSLKRSQMVKDRNISICNIVPFISTTLFQNNTETALLVHKFFLCKEGNSKRVDFLSGLSYHREPRLAMYKTQLHNSLLLPNSTAFCRNVHHMLLHGNFSDENQCLLLCNMGMRYNQIPFTCP